MLMIHITKISLFKFQNFGTKDFNYSKAFIEYLNKMNDIYQNIEDYNPNKK